jgi:ATP-dependent DNA helicase RecQ
MTATPASILKSVFGYDQFRPLQAEVIEHVLQKRDTLAIMPTGGGKSLCYQIPALLFPGLTVVVSPLIALMKDQVEQLHELGVPALFLNSSLSLEEYRRNMAQVRSGKVKLLYAAPETLLTQRLFDLLGQVTVDCITIDEAHCISEWGHDFRPEYRQLVEVRKRFPGAACLALTATATQRVREDIKSTLKFKASDEFLASFDRENLMIEVAEKTDAQMQTLAFLRQRPGQSGIIYCFSRKQVDELAAFLAKKSFSVRPYHAGLEDDQRRRNQEAFIRDDVQIIVATIAFGMGINKPNVRFVIHYDLPKSIENYYQEIGRAGRDGLPAHCLLLYSYADVKKQEYFIHQKEDQERRVAEQHLEAMVQYAETDACRRSVLLAYFGESYLKTTCKMCDRCLSVKVQVMETDMTLAAQKYLSCVKRTGEIFGAQHIVDVLLGANTAKVRKFDHQNLSTYGIGKELEREQWLDVGRQMLAKGLLVQDRQYGSLKTTPAATSFLNNKETLRGAAPRKKTAAPVDPGKAAGGIDANPELFELLRAKRKELADAAQVPPYVIFSDRTLAEMAYYFPCSMKNMLEINGVGQVKAERYGNIFLGLIVAFCREHELSEKKKKSARKTTTAEQDDRSTKVAKAYNKGRSMAELADEYRVQPATVLAHLTRYAMMGNSVRLGEDIKELTEVPAAQRAAVFAAFKELGTEYLRPIFERLNGHINYDELKTLRLMYLCR